MLDLNSNNLNIIVIIFLFHCRTIWHVLSLYSFRQTGWGVYTDLGKSYIHSVPIECISYKNNILMPVNKHVFHMFLIYIQNVLYETSYYQFY